MTVTYVLSDLVTVHAHVMAKHIHNGKYPSYIMGNIGSLRRIPFRLRNNTVTILDCLTFTY